MDVMKVGMKYVRIFTRIFFHVTGNLILTDSGVLLIHNATVRDSGSYVCTAQNHITSDTFVSPTFTNLQVVRKGTLKRKAPEFLLRPKSNIIIPAGT